MSGGFGAARAAAYVAAARQAQRQQFLGMDAYQRHRKMVQDLITYYGGQLPAGGQAAPGRSDHDILRDSFRFIRSEGEDAEAEAAGGSSWEVRLARRYYSKLFKEYAIADLSRHKEGKVGLRWRTQKEVVSGRGQFICGAKGCEERRGLASFEVPFAYQEAGERKQALVKVRICPTHAYQLHYRRHKEAETAAREEKERRRRKRKRSEERRQRKEKQQQRRRSKGAGGKKEQRGGRKAGSSSPGGSTSSSSSSDSSSSSSSSSDSSSSSSSSSDSSSSSSSSKDEEQRSGRKQRRRSSGGEERPAAQGQQQQPAAAAPAAEAPAENDYEAFLQGLFD